MICRLLLYCVTMVQVCKMGAVGGFSP
jgi:hypothetical protein